MPPSQAMGLPSASLLLQSWALVMLMAVKEGEEGEEDGLTPGAPHQMKSLHKCQFPLIFRQFLSQFTVPAPLGFGRAVSGHASLKCQAACQGQGVRRGAQFAVTLSLQRQDSLLLPATLLWAQMSTQSTQTSLVENQNICDTILGCQSKEQWKHETFVLHECCWFCLRKSYFKIPGEKLLTGFSIPDLKAPDKKQTHHSCLYRQVKRYNRFIKGQYRNGEETEPISQVWQNGFPNHGTLRIRMNIPVYKYICIYTHTHRILLGICKTIIIPYLVF